MKNIQRPTTTVEDYLGVIYTLARDGEVVIGRKLADWLSVSPPTVTATLQRMVRDGYVTMSDDKSVHLTERGREAAISVLRRHMLSELLLARVLGVPWSRLHDEADRLEHGFSADTMARVARMVDDTHLCPHGNPFPGHERLTRGLVPLLEAPPGETVTLARIHEEIERNPRLMAFLEKNCLVPGALVELIEVLPDNETVSVATAGHTVVLGLNVARRMWVECGGPPTSEQP